MKILPFDPSYKPVKTNATGSGRPQSLSFEAELARAKANSGAKAIHSENLLASQAVSPEDLGTAGELVKALVTQITAASPQKINNIHKLDGVLYYFPA
ncbi:MAG: hypothetical protein LBS60_06040 [Deltaproteobacteria bacterium]|jgi:hypothetical protein|nr:hypothetical protein [Deltaproteobacteria bacterium]